MCITKIISEFKAELPSFLNKIGRKTIINNKEYFVFVIEIMTTKNKIYLVKFEKFVLDKQAECIPKFKPPKIQESYQF